MKKTELKKLIKEAFLTEKKSNLLNENSPGFDNRKQGGALPTLESVKAAYQAKKLKEASTEEELEATEKLTAAVKDLGDAKEEAGLNEDRFVDSSLEDLEQVVRNLAHTADLSEEDAAELAINHIQDMFSEEELDEGVEKDYWADYTDIGMFYIGIDAKHSLSDQQLKKLGEKIVKQIYGGDVGKAYDDIVRGKKRGSHTDVNEAKMEKELKHISTEDKKSKELTKIANELFPEIAKKQEGGKLVNFKPLSKAQRDEVYAEYAKLNESVIAEADMIVELFKK